MLNKSETGVYYLKDFTKEQTNKNDNFKKDTLESILALRDDKKEAIDYYLNLLEDSLKDYKLEDFDIVTSVPSMDEDNMSEGMMKLLKKLSDNHNNLECIQCLNREGSTINSCYEDLKDKNILLFDYLAAKGTSLNACKETLKRADANLVVCIALEKASK